MNCYFYDEDVMHLENDLKIGVENEKGYSYLVNDYLYGRCNIFGLALISVFGQAAKIKVLMELVRNDKC